MKNRVRITLHPQGTEIDLEHGTPLHDVLFGYGVEFPCGGKGQCKGCRVRVLSGSLNVTPQQEHMLTEEELDAGWRLSCQCVAESDLVLELAQWEASILTDTTRFAFTPREGLGIAIDIGTTTIVTQLVEMETGNVLSVRTALNPQARFGADVMSRVSVAITGDGRGKLVEVLRRQLRTMIAELLEASAQSPSRLMEIVLVGNTVMHHLFCDLDLEPLAHYPFESPTLGAQRLTVRQLGWTMPSDPIIRFLPCIGGYVGSDILAGILATGVHESDRTSMLIDLGTNGEIVLGDRHRLICSSTAAGPAFEGARIYMGMRASTGAISEVTINEGKLVCHVLGNVSPRGICGSGLVDAAAAFLTLSMVQPSGRLSNGEGYLTLCQPVRVSQTDIRELQLAKGAIAAGVRILLQEIHAAPTSVDTVHLAGAFGNYVNVESAIRIGLMPFPAEVVRPAGNTALLGAKMALFLDEAFCSRLAAGVEHISLHAHPSFQDLFVEEMGFPAQATHGVDR